MRFGAGKDGQENSKYGHFSRSALYAGFVANEKKRCEKNYDIFKRQKNSHKINEMSFMLRRFSSLEPQRKSVGCYRYAFRSFLSHLSILLTSMRIGFDGISFIKLFS